MELLINEYNNNNNSHSVHKRKAPDFWKIEAIVTKHWMCLLYIWSKRKKEYGSNRVRIT